MYRHDRKIMTAETYKFFRDSGSVLRGLGLSEKVMEELTLELSLEGGVDLGNTGEENGRWAFRAEPTT